MKLKELSSLALVLGMVTLAAMCKPSAGASGQEGVTFNNQVVRILQQHCQVCHHPGDIGPFSFMTYSETRIFAEVIRDATRSGEMPPWSPAEGCGEFDGVRGLTQEEISTFAQWVVAGKPEGNPADLPPPLQFTADWRLGPPDVVLQPDGDFAVGLGDDLFRCFSLPTNLRGDRFLSAIDIKPQGRSVVHHAAVYLDEAGASKPLDDADPVAGYDCGGGDSFMTTGAMGWWAPGTQARFEPDRTGWRVPKDSRLVLQVHYHVHHGGGGNDRTQVGLYFARKPVRKELRTLPVINTNFLIPAGDPHFKITASTPPISSGNDAHAIAIAPHMHLLGREMKVEAANADGSTQCLINIEQWDPTLKTRTTSKSR